MAHFPKPFFRPKRNRVELDGKHLNLGQDRKTAFRHYYDLMAKRKHSVPVVSTSADPALITLLDAFLDWCLKHREKRTYETY